MKTIAIGFSKPAKTKPLSWLIQKILRTEYSHVYVRFTTNSGKNIIYQASGLQVNFVGEALFKEHCLIVKECEIDVSDEIFQKMMDFAIDKAGYPYSIGQLFNIVIYKLTGKAKTITSGRSAYICSELVGEILKLILGVKVDKNLDVITPSDIDKILTEAGLWQD